MSWKDGKPTEPGHYWLRLKYTDKISEKLEGHIAHCYVHFCPCHMEINHTSSERMVNNIKKGFVAFDKYFKLPE